LNRAQPKAVGDGVFSVT